MNIATQVAIHGSTNSAGQAQARIEQCRKTVENFDSKAATVTEMQQYASCVNRLHPSEQGINPGFVIFVIFAIAWACVIRFAYVNFK